MFRTTGLAFAALVGLAGAAAAQTFTLPEIGLQNSGPCRQLAVRDRSNSAQVKMGCVDTSTHGWVSTPNKLTLPTTDQGSTGDMSGMSVAPNASSTSGSLGSILARGTTVPGLKPQGILFDGAPPISHIPTGNPTISTGSLVLQTYTNQQTTREIAASIGMVATTGANKTGTGADGNGDKIALYTGIRALSGSFNTWSINPLTEITSDNTTWAGDWIIEADKNNLSQDVGDAAGPAGLSDKHSWGIQVVAGGLESIAKRNTAGFSIFSLTDRGVWNRGYLCQSRSVKLSCYEDHSNAATMIQDWGSHAISIDLRNATTSIGGLALKNGMPILGRSSANTSDVPLLYNTSGTTVLGAETNISLQKPTTVFAALTVTPGTSPNSTGQPSGTFAGTIYNNTNASGQNGLLVKNNFATPASTVLEVGVDVVGGAYNPALRVTGDRKLYLWDGSTMSAVTVGPAGSGPGGSGRALYLP